MNCTTIIDWKRALVRLALPSVLALAVGAAALIGLHLSGGHPAQADFPHPGLNFSVSAGAGSEQCDSDGAGGLPVTCMLMPNATFRVNFRVDALPSGFAYSGYDSTVSYTSGLTANGASLTQQGPGTWDACIFANPYMDPGNHVVSPGCAIGLPPALASTYTGVMWYISFSCGPSNSAETITLANGDGRTDLVDDSSIAHGEAIDESITIDCGPVTPTNTPTITTTPGPTTPTPTRTATRTPTRTPTPAGCARLGDVNGDGRTDSLDALSILQADAQLIPHVPHPECGDVNHDGHINSIDALFVLQIDAGLLPQPSR